MAELKVYWRTPGFVPEAQDTHQARDVRTGMLTDAHDAATPDAPVLVEELSSRVYRPDDLPPETVVYIEDHPGDLPPLARQAKLAGFRVEHALHDEGLEDRPYTPRPETEAESPVQPRDPTPPTD